MATLTDVRSVNATLTGVTVDTVTITGSSREVVVSNLVGATTLWVRAGAAGATLDDPVANAEGCIPILTGKTEIVRQSGGAGATVKILGNGNNYSVAAMAKGQENTLTNMRVGTVSSPAYLVEIAETETNLTADKSVARIRAVASASNTRVAEFWGKSALRVEAEDAVGVIDGTDPYLYGVRVRMVPRVGRNNSGIDDVVGVAILNKSFTDTGSQFNGTEALYIGYGGGGATKDWNAGIGVDTVADNAMYIARGPYAYGILMTGTVTTAAIRIPNAAKIVARNAADSGNVDLLSLNASNQVVLGPVTGTIRTGIGQAAPGFPIDVSGTAVVDGNISSVGRVHDLAGFAAGVGGGISFSGNTDATPTVRTFGAIRAIKALATSGNAAGDLVFYSRDPSTGLHEGMRIDSAGVIKIPAVAATGGLIELNELSGDAANGAANTGRLYLKDNGSGKTQLCVRFNTGTAIVLATQA